MSVAAWFGIGGIAILLFAIGGLLWTRRVSAAEEYASRTRRSAGRTLSAEEIRSFGRPTANTPNRPILASVHPIRPKATPAVAIHHSDTPAFNDTGNTNSSSDSTDSCSTD